MPFHIGDQVVHPHHGVGTITKLADREFAPGVTHSYYEIAIPSGTLWVPVDGPGLGVRRLTAKSELVHCSHILEGAPSTIDVAPRQMREFLADRLKAGTIIAQCEVVRDLTALSWRKPLLGAMADFRRMALNVLCQEWSIVAEISLAEATHRINAYLGKGKQAYSG